MISVSVMNWITRMTKVATMMTGVTRMTGLTLMFVKSVIT